MKRITGEAKDNNLSFALIRNQLKEYLQYFALDFIYNSEFKNLIFYGGSCLRIIYDLPRMSEDLDFEAEDTVNFNALAKGLRDHFQKDLKLKEKFSSKKEKGINRIFLSFPIMYELGLSPNKNESLKIKVEIRPEPKTYFEKLNTTLAMKSKYGKSFVIKHYDLPTLFASKLAAILDRPQKGFTVGGPEKEINFKGRDFYDLIWYMERGILPNEEMLKANGINDPVREVFDKISVFISQADMKKGLEKDLGALFISQNFVENFAATFRRVFRDLKKESYTAKRVKELKKITVYKKLLTNEYDFNVYYFKFDYLCENETLISFLFKMQEYFITLKKIDASFQLTPDHLNKIDFRIPMGAETKNQSKKYAALFLSKISDYLKQHNNKVYFNKWESKLIKTTDYDFNPEKEIVFSPGQELASNKNITLEVLSL